MSWYRPDPNSADDKIYFCSLYKHSPDFVKLICQYIKDLEPKLSLLYEDAVDTKGKVVQENIIDSIVYGEETGAALIRDAKKRSVLQQTYYEYIDSLKDWLKRRNTWMQKYYGDMLETMN